MSKSYVSPLVYVILSDLGFFAKEVLENFRQSSSMLQDYPDKNKIPGIDMSLGSLGQELSM